MATSSQRISDFTEYLLMTGAAVKCFISDPVNQCHIEGVAPITIPFVVISVQIQFHDFLQYVFTGILYMIHVADLLRYVLGNVKDLVMEGIERKN